MKKNKGFTLLEVLISLGLLAIIGIYIMPALSNILKNSKRIKEDTKEIYAVQAVLEENKKRGVSSFTKTYNGYKVYVEISPYGEDMKKISAKSGNIEFHLVVNK